MADSVNIAAKQSEYEEGAVSARRNKAIALVRALGTVAEDDRSYISFARETILSHELVGLLATASSPNGLRPLTEKGRRELKRAESSLTSALDYSIPFHEALNDIEASCSALNTLVEQSHTALANLDGPMPDVLNASEADGFARFIAARLSATCYFTALRFGAERLDPLRNLLINANDPERSYQLCNKGLAKLKDRLRAAEPCGSWRIDPITHPGCDCIAPRKGYALQWTDEAEYGRAVDAGEVKEINPGFAIGRIGTVYRYMGTGYIVGTPPSRAYALKEHEVHTKLPINAFGTSMQRLDQPIEMIAAYFNGDEAFSIKPTDFAAAIDRYARCTEAGVV